MPLGIFFNMGLVERDIPNPFKIALPPVRCKNPVANYKDKKTERQKYRETKR